MDLLVNLLGSLGHIERDKYLKNARKEKPKTWLEERARQQPAVVDSIQKEVRNRKAGRAAGPSPGENARGGPYRCLWRWSSHGRLSAPSPQSRACVAWRSDASCPS